MEGYKISLVEIPSQNSSPRPVSKKEEERMIEHEEIEEILNELEQFVSSIFIAPKKSSRLRPVINLKNLSSHAECNDFKMEDLFLLNEFFEEGDDLFKLDLKTLIFSVSSPSLSKVCKISMETEVVLTSLPLF